MADRAQPAQAGQTLADEGQRIVVRANYELFVLFVSAFQVINSILIVVLRNDLAQPIPIRINQGIFTFLIIDFLYRIWRTPNRRRFLFQFHGYLVFIGSLPFPFAGLFRLMWYRQATRHLQRTDYAMLERVVVERRAQSAMLLIFAAAITVLEVGSILILEAESLSPDANIANAHDAIWWSLVTMATVGYGDFYPVTASGRIVALFVMVVGVGIFTVLTSFFAQSFIKPRQVGDEAKDLSAPADPGDPRSNLLEIKNLLDRQEADRNASLMEIRKKLDMLEEQLGHDQGVD